jgi:NAD(P)-dependent dehydrogenase (short-subunit alcohol dehydrogenase family)
LFLWGLASGEWRDDLRRPGDPPAPAPAFPPGDGAGGWCRAVESTHERETALLNHVRTLLGVAEDVWPAFPRAFRTGRLTVTGTACLAPLALATAASEVTKAALLQMTRDIALYNGRFGIHVNCCAPGPIFTQGGTVAHAAREGRDGSVLVAELAHDVSLRRMGTPDECARAIYLLCSEDAAYVTGTTLHVDGGFCRK